MGVSKNRGGPPKSSILIGFSIIFTIHFGGKIPLFLGSTPIWSNREKDIPAVSLAYEVFVFIWLMKSVHLETRRLKISRGVLFDSFPHPSYTVDASPIPWDKGQTLN